MVSEVLLEYLSLHWQVLRLSHVSDPCHRLFEIYVVHPASSPCACAVLDCAFYGLCPAPGHPYVEIFRDVSRASDLDEAACTVLAHAGHLYDACHNLDRNIFDPDSGFYGDCDTKNDLRVMVSGDPAPLDGRWPS